MNNMITQDRAEEIRANLTQLRMENESYKGSGWNDEKFNRVLNFLDTFENLDKPLRLLDLGCGGMTLSNFLKRNSNFKVIGVDLVKDLLLQLSRKRAPDIPLTAGDMEFLPFTDSCFDIAIHNQVLHHFFHLQPILQEIRRVLKPGGILCSIETNGWNPYVNLWHRFSYYKRVGIISDNESPFGYPKLKRDLEKSGFEIAGVRMINFDFVSMLSNFDSFFGKIPLFRLIFGGSMVVCSRRIT